MDLQTEHSLFTAYVSDW